MWSRCPRGKRKRWKRRKRRRKDCATGRITVDICRGHRAEECQLFVYALARIQHHGDLFSPACVAEEHKLLQGDDAGSWSRLEVVSDFYWIRKLSLTNRHLAPIDSRSRQGNGPTAITFTHSLAKRKSQHCELPRQPHNQHPQWHNYRSLSSTSIYRYHYWLLYRLPEFPDPEAAPGNQLIAPVGKFLLPSTAANTLECCEGAKEDLISFRGSSENFRIARPKLLTQILLSLSLTLAGVDELMVEDGEHYLYWYKKL